MAGNDVLNSSGTSTSVQYVYLDFDGEHTTYRNQDLRISFSATVRDPGFSEAQRKAILNGLKEKYASSGIVFTTDRPDSASCSTLYFGQCDAFRRYGEYFGVSETFDEMNSRQNDNAYVLLDSTYSTDQIVSVSGKMLDNILGNTYMVDSTAGLKAYAANPYLLSTGWTQNDPYNKYCPVDPSTNKRSVAGCTNVAAAQVIYYWIETGLLDLTLTVNSSDGYTRNNITVNDEKANVAQFDYLSFSDTNKLLSDFKLGDADSIAALCFAAGVVQQASYSSSSTSTPYARSLLTRAGLENGITEYLADKSGSRYYKEDYGGLTESGREILIGELLAGRPVLASIRYGNGKSNGVEEHAIVIDGYNSSANTVHLNFGWGGRYNNWYTLDELNDNFGIYDMFTGITPNVSPKLAIQSMSFKANAVNRNDAVTLNVSVANQGKKKSAQATLYVYCGRKQLSAITVPSLAAGDSRSLSCTFDAASLSLGANSITVRAYSSGGSGRISSVSKTVKVYDGAVTSADNSWKAASEAGDWTKTAAEYDSAGTVAETVLAEGEYVGYHDLVDYREVTLAHAGRYTFTLSGVTGTLEASLYRLNENGKLKLLRTLTVCAPSTGGKITDAPLERGTYYISVKAPNAESHGDSDYGLSFSGTGYLKGNDLDDWSDLKKKGAAGNVLSVGIIDAGTTDVLTDEWVGLGDAVDYRNFWIQAPAMLSFTVTASDAAKFTIYELTEKTGKKDGLHYELKKLQSTKIKAGATVTTDALPLPVGNDIAKYYFSMESTNAKKGGSADYSVTFNPSGSVFFPKGDVSDNWTDLKTKGPEGAVGDAGTLNADRDVVLEGWAGFGDEVDYAKITLESAARLFFSLSASDAAKFAVCRLDGKTGRDDVTTWSLKTLQTTKLSRSKDEPGYAANTKGLLLEAGEYCIVMTSTNAKKGGSADYSVQLRGDVSEFFTKGDASDDWTDLKTKGPEGAVGDLGVIDGAEDILLENWVGFGDAVDYRRFTLESAATLGFSVAASGKTKFTVYRLEEKTSKDGSPVYSLKKIQSVSLSKKKDGPGYAAVTKPKMFEAGDYCFRMESTDAAKGGSADYTVSLDPDACVFPAHASDACAFPANPTPGAPEACAHEIPSLPAADGMGFAPQDSGLCGSGTDALCAAPAPGMDALCAAPGPADCILLA